MSNPKDIGSIGLAANASGSILSAFGSLSSGVSNSNMYQYQAGIAQINQQLDAQNAEFARQTGEESALQFGLKAGAQMGQIKVAQASSGFDVRSGSNAQVRASQTSLNALDTDVIRSDAAKTAYNYEVQGSIAGDQATLYSSAASDALAAGVVGTGSSVLGGVGSVSSMWLKGQQSGLWGAT